jgi:PncC family amidohydrolase
MNNLDTNLLSDEIDVLSAELVSLLKSKKLKLSVAESCTGGMISSLITDIPGASEIFNGAIIAYSNDVKINQLNVSVDNLNKFGAVSEIVAGEMVKGVKSFLNSDVAISVTGIAGPGGGSVDKPVGTVCFGFVINGKIITVINKFNGNRENVKKHASFFAIDYLRKHLL